MKHLLASFIPAILLHLMIAVPALSETTAYFPNAGDNNIKRVVVNDESNFAEVDTCQGPYGAAVTPDGNRVVATCVDDNAIRIIPTVNFFDAVSQIGTDLGAGRTPRGVAIESRGTYAYVANYGNNTVDEIVVSSGAVTQTYAVGAGPWGVAAFYDSVAATSRVYVSNHDEDSLSVISNSGVATIASVGDGPLGVALTPDGSQLYVANLNDNQVVVIDTSDESIDATINVGVGPWGVAMADDGAYVFVTNSLDDTVSVIATSSQSVSGTYSVGDQPTGVAAPINGRFAYVVNQTGNSVTKITTGGATSTLGSSEFNGAFSLGAFVGDNPPEAPTLLVTSTASDSTVELSWTDNSSNEDGFKIERRQEGQAAYTQIATVGEDVTSYTDSGLNNDIVYFYRVRAYNEAANSDYTVNDTDDFSWCFIGMLLR